jgi:hypothetical protein
MGRGDAQIADGRLFDPGDPCTASGCRLRIQQPAARWRRMDRSPTRSTSPSRSSRCTQGWRSAAIPAAVIGFGRARRRRAERAEFEHVRRVARDDLVALGDDIRGGRHPCA